MEERTKRLLLVDGSNLLFQMFFGMPARIVNGAGKPIQGTLGFVGALFKILRRTAPTHAAVLFDGEHENARAALDPGYKADRPDYGAEPAERNPFSQLPDVYEALRFLRIPFAETETCETDDWIAGYARACAAEMEVVIASFDSDFFQLLSDRVSVLRYRGERTAVCTPEFLREKFDVAPAQYADFKSLTGDASDHIKGAKGVGPKTAAKLLDRFGTLENLLANAGEIERPALRASILQDAERLRTNARLIRLDGDVPLPFPLEALEYRPPDVTAHDVLRGIGVL